MLEHPSLELLQLEARLDSKLVAERLSRSAVELQRVGLLLGAYVVFVARLLACPGDVVSLLEYLDFDSLDLI